MAHEQPIFLMSIASWLAGAVAGAVAVKKHRVVGALAGAVVVGAIADAIIERRQRLN